MSEPLDNLLAEVGRLPVRIVPAKVLYLFFLHLDPALEIPNQPIVGSSGQIRKEVTDGVVGNLER
jgi:hypothetical protein